MRIYPFLFKKHRIFLMMHYVKLNLKSISLILLLLLLNRCIFFPGIGPQQGIEVFNNTDSILYVAYSFSDSLGNGNPLVLFEDVNIDSNEVHAYKHNYKKHKQSPCYRLDAYSYGGIGIPGRESLLLSCDANKLRLFFISESTMREKSWEEICTHQLYEKKLTLTRAELIEDDWIVVYE